MSASDAWPTYAARLRMNSKSASPERSKAKRGRVKCEYCEGRGYFVTGAGLAALQDKYPEFPIREIQNRGWLGFPDEADGDAYEPKMLAALRMIPSREQRIRVVDAIAALYGLEAQ